MKLINQKQSPAAVDLHIHSNCSSDSTTTILEYATRAPGLGLKELGFSEHVDFDPRDMDYGHLNRAAYDGEIARARTVVPEIQLRQGVEVAYQHFREQEIQSWLASNSWDFVIASIHVLDYADGWAIVSDRDSSGRYFAAHNQHQVYRPYFEELLSLAQSGIGDVIGHFDIVKRFGTAYYGPFRPADYQEEILAILRTVIDRGVGLEINTSGWRQAPAEPYPSPTILRWYSELGGEILTIGSDSHSVANLGSGFPEALDLARQIGFRAIATFEMRRIRWLDL